MIQVLRLLDVKMLKLSAMYGLLTYSAGIKRKHMSEEIEKYKDSTYWLGFYPPTDVRWDTVNFPDSSHHTGFYYSALLLLNKPVNLTDLRSGYAYRRTPEGTLRHLNRGGSRDYFNRDQLTPLVYPLSMLDLGDNFIDEILDTNTIEAFPHVYIFFNVARGRHVNYLIRLFADVSEFLNMLLGYIVDKIKRRQAGRIKSIYRIYLNHKLSPTFLSGLVKWTAFKLVDVNKTFTDYFTFKHEGRDSPPPIHKLWLEIFKNG